MSGRPVAGGGRAVRVGAGRIGGWFERFAENHGGARETVLGPHRVTVSAADGASAEVTVPFAPLPCTDRTVPGLEVAPLVEHLSAPRRVGLVLVRRGAHSVGIASGGAVLVSATDRHHVQGRTAAGGRSQRRYARRRADQARRALDSAAADVRRVLLPEVGSLDAVVLGGDRGALAQLRADTACAPVFALAEPWVLDVPEPRRRVLDDAAVRVTEAEVVVREKPVTSG